MGRGLTDIVNRHKLPYRFTDKPGMVGLQTRAGEKSPVEISAEILATLRHRAEDTFNDDLYGAVITVPAYFDEAQRQATKDAAQLAGIQVLRLMSRPRRPSRTAWTTRARACTPCTTWAAGRSTFPFCG